MVCYNVAQTLQLLTTVQAGNMPFLLKNFWQILYPSSALYGHSTAFLRHSTSSTMTVKLFCQDSAADFPTKVLEDVTFHDFLTEWDRRVAEECHKLDPSNGTSEADPAAQACGSTALSPCQPPLSSYFDVFLGNIHLKDLSDGLMEAIGESPFELAKAGLSEDFDDTKSTKSPSSVPTGEKGRLWMGNATHTSHLHFDAHDGLLITLFGKKTATLYDPLVHLDIIEKSKGGNHASKNPLKSSLGPSALPLHGEIMPGDALYIPLYWWHLIESTESSIAVNYWNYPSLTSSTLKFTSMWSFTSRLCTEIIQNLLSQMDRPSRMSLLSRQHCLSIVERILRFSLQAVLPTLPLPTKAEEPLLLEDSEIEAKWYALIEEAIQKVREQITTFR